MLGELDVGGHACDSQDRRWLVYGVDSMAIQIADGCARADKAHEGDQLIVTEDHFEDIDNSQSR